MGQAKYKRIKFFKSHPHCCLCGGKNIAVTIEHTPPKALFLRSRRPKGMEFPSCKRCNNGSSESDIFTSLIALIQAPAMLSGGPKFNEYDAQFNKLLDGVKNNVLKNNKIFFAHHEIEAWVNGLIRTFPTIKLKPEAYTDYLEPWFAKQTIALWYEHTGRIFTENGAIRIYHYMTHEKQKYAKLISNLPTDFLSPAQNLSQGLWRTPDQFQYKYNFLQPSGTGLCIVELHRGLCFFAAIADMPNHSFSQNASLLHSNIVWRTSAEKGIYSAKAIQTKNA